MAPLMVKQLEELKGRKGKKAESLAQNVMEPFQVVKLDPINLDESSTTCSEHIWNKRPWGKDHQEDDVHINARQSVRLTAHQLTPLSRPDERRMILGLVTGDGSRSLWDERFAFPKLIDSFFAAKIDEEKIKALSVGGACNVRNFWLCF